MKINLVKLILDLTSLASEKEDARRRTEERKAERQKTIEAKRAAKKGPMKLGAKKAAFDWLDLS